MLSNKKYDTLVWIPTKGTYPQFDKILIQSEKLKHNNFLFIITYEKFNLKIFSLLKSNKFNNYIYLKKINSHLNNTNFENIISILKFLKIKFNYKLKYLIISSDDDMLVNKFTYRKQLKILEENKNISFVAAPVVMINEKKETININLDSKLLNGGAEFLDYFSKNINLQHACINSIFRIKSLLDAQALIGLSLYKRGLWDGFGMDYNLFLKLAFLPNKKVKIINELPSRIILQHSTSMTSKFPITFSFCYYLYSTYLKKILKKKYILKNIIFENFIFIRIEEMIRCYFVVFSLKKIESKAYPINIPKNFLSYCLIESFKELNLKNFIRILIYIFKLQKEYYVTNKKFIKINLN